MRFYSAIKAPKPTLDKPGAEDEDVIIQPLAKLLLPFPFGSFIVHELLHPQVQREK